MSSTTSPKLVPEISGSRVLRWLTRMAVAGINITALVGVLHMPFAAPLLRALPGAVCPLTKGSPEQIDRAHEIGAESIRRSAMKAAPIRPALGFELDRSTKADLDAWAAKHGVTCKNISGNETLQRCSDVPPEAVGHDPSLGRLEEVTFEFRATGTLTTVQTMRRSLTNDQAAATARWLEDRLAGQLGPPSTSGGEATAAHLGHGLMSTFVAEHSFTDYRASVAATNLAPTGVMVREAYISAR